MLLKWLLDLFLKLNFDKLLELLNLPEGTYAGELLDMKSLAKKLVLSGVIL